jgi:hypothetical protein
VTALVESLCLTNTTLKQVLDLRERGSETVSHSEGTGIAAFTTKSNNSGVIGGSDGSPYVPTQRLKNDRSFGQTHPRNGPGAPSTIGSNILTSIGSILPELDQEEDLEMDNMSIGLGFGRKGSMKTVRGEGSSGEGSDVMSPAPAYNSLEMGFNLSQLQANTVSGIRVDVEKTTSSI